jgi:hypothetical protein
MMDGGRFITIFNIGPINAKAPSPKIVQESIMQKPLTFATYRLEN